LGNDKDGKPNLDESTVTARLKLNNTTPPITEATWEEYIKKAANITDLDDRKTKVEKAIKECRKPQQPGQGKKPLPQTVINGAFTKAGSTVRPAATVIDS